MSTAELAPYNLIASFRDLERATDAVGALREGGFEPDDVSLLGQPVEEVDAHSEDATGEPVGGNVATEVAAGGAGGAAVGGVLGALGGVVAATVPGVGLVAGTGALLGALSGGGFGGTVGALVEGESAMRSSHGWQQTIEAVAEGAVVVGVHTDDRKTLDRALRTVRPLNPMSLRTVDERGNGLNEEDAA